MPHRNAILTETGRLHLAQLVVDQGWTLRRAAERFGVAVNTARRWAQRYREQGFIALGLRIPGHGTVPAGLVDIDWETWLAAQREPR